MPPLFWRQLFGLPSRVEYLSPQGVLLPLVYGTTASPLWLELRGHSAWQAILSWTVYRLACHRLLQWLRVTFAMVPDKAWPGWDQWPCSTAPATGPVGRLGRPSASDPSDVGSFLSLGRPTCSERRGYTHGDATRPPFGGSPRKAGPPGSTWRISKTGDLRTTTPCPGWATFRGPCSSCSPPTLQPLYARSWTAAKD